MQTKAGNPKVPSFHDVTEWTLEWMSSVYLEILAKAFCACGIIHPSQFRVDNLSESLSSLFDTPFDMDRWEAEYGGLIEAEEVENGYNHAIYCPPDWYLPENEISSLYLSVLKIKYPQLGSLRYSK
jgi:hypothetical protein